MAGSDDDDDLPTDMTQVDDRKYAVVVIKPNGIIRIANEKVSKLFGYKPTELMGKNVNILMPQPYSQQHNGMDVCGVLGCTLQVLQSARWCQYISTDTDDAPLFSLG